MAEAEGEKPAEAIKAQDLKKGRETAQQIFQVPCHMAEGEKGRFRSFFMGNIRSRGMCIPALYLLREKLRGTGYELRSDWNAGIW